MSGRYEATAEREHDAQMQATLAGLPPDLARVLRDPNIIVPQDAAVFEAVANAPLFAAVLSWMNAKSNTASADATKGGP